MCCVSLTVHRWEWMSSCSIDGRSQHIFNRIKQKAQSVSQRLITWRTNVIFSILLLLVFFSRQSMRTLATFRNIIHNNIYPVALIYRLPFAGELNTTWRNLLSFPLFVWFGLAFNATIHRQTLTVGRCERTYNTISLVIHLVLVFKNKIRCKIGNIIFQSGYEIFNKKKSGLKKSKPIEVCSVLFSIEIKILMIRVVIRMNKSTQ